MFLLLLSILLEGTVKVISSMANRRSRSYRKDFSKQVVIGIY
jgi:hypothetical protein